MGSTYLTHQTETLARQPAKQPPRVFWVWLQLSLADQPRPIGLFTCSDNVGGECLSQVFHPFLHVESTSQDLGQVNWDSSCIFAYRRPAADCHS